MTNTVYDYAWIAVPADMASLFTRLRDRMMSGELDVGALVGDAPVEQVVDVPGQGGWTLSMVDRVRDRLTYPLVRRLLDTCAERPGEWVSKAEIDEFSENGPLQLRNELGAFSKLTKRLFGRLTWPIEYTKTDGGYKYRMMPLLAAMWMPQS